jgi:uncharacterized RDD family membrane protein YckC
MALPEMQRSATVAFEQATSYRRLWARVLDVLILGTALMIFVLIVALLASQIRSGLFGYLSLAAAIGIPLAYDTLYISLNGKTLGMSLLGIRIIDARGERIGLGWSLLRTIVFYLVLSAFIFLTIATASVIGWIVIVGLRRFSRFPWDAASHSYAVRVIKGQLNPVQLPTAGITGAPAPTPFADLEALHNDGIISDEEYLRKRKELSV